MIGTWGGGVHLYVCGMCVVYVWLIDVGGVGVVVSPQGGDRWEMASGRSASGHCQGVAPTVPGEGGRLGRRELARPGMQGRQGIRVSWMWRGGAGAPRVPWRASLEAGDAGQSKTDETFWKPPCVMGMSGRGRRPEGALEGIPRGWRRRSVKTDEAFLSLGALAAGRGGSGSGLGGCPPPRPVGVARGESMYDWGLVRDREERQPLGTRARPRASLGTLTRRLLVTSICKPVSVAACFD